MIFSCPDCGGVLVTSGVGVNHLECSGCGVSFLVEVSLIRVRGREDDRPPKLRPALPKEGS